MGIDPDQADAHSTLAGQDRRDGPGDRQLLIRGSVVDPSDTDRSPLRRAGPRGSPDHQRLAAAHVAGGEHVGRRGLVVVGVGADVAALGRGRRRASSACPRARDGRNPWRAAQSSAIELELGAGSGLNFSSTLTQCSFVTLPSARRISASARRIRAPRLSAWLDEVRILSGQFGQVRALVLMLGRAGMISSWVTDFAPCRERGADAVRAGVAAADHDDMLAAGQISLAAPSGSEETRRFCAQEIHREMDAVELAGGIGRSRPASAPPVSATASYWASKFARIDRALRGCLQYGRRNGTSTPRLPSARRGGR